MKKLFAAILSGLLLATLTFGAAKKSAPKKDGATVANKVPPVKTDKTKTQKTTTKSEKQ